MRKRLLASRPLPKAHGLPVQSHQIRKHPKFLTSKSVGVIEETLDSTGCNGEDVVFYVDPLLLKQTIEEGFFYYPETKLILFINTLGFKCLLQTRRPII